MITDPGCTANAIAPNDIQLFLPVDLPFWVHYGGRSFHRLRVSNTGYVSFRDPANFFQDPDYDAYAWRGAYEDSTLNVAPFWSVGTGRTITGGPTTRFGMATFQGRPAFCVNWVGAATGDLCISTIRSIGARPSASSSHRRSQRRRLRRHRHRLQLRLDPMGPLDPL